MPRDARVAGRPAGAAGIEDPAPLSLPEGAPSRSDAGDPVACGVAEDAVLGVACRRVDAGDPGGDCDPDSVSEAGGEGARGLSGA